MPRLHWALFLLVISLGCQAPAERVPVMPLPAEGQPLAYDDILHNARFQASAANEAFYLDKWSELDDAAAALEKTAGYLPKATDVPAALKATLGARAAELQKLGGQLRTAAKGKDVKKANELLQQINLKVRELRPAK
jgi:hypothetical protein